MTREERKNKLTSFIMQVLSEYTGYSNDNEEIYFTFVKNEGRIIANVCQEDKEIDSFILNIEPSDKRFIFKKPE